MTKADLKIQSLLLFIILTKKFPIGILQPKFKFVICDPACGHLMRKIGHFKVTVPHESHEHIS